MGFQETYSDLMRPGETRQRVDVINNLLPCELPAGSLMSSTPVTLTRQAELAPSSTNAGRPVSMSANENDDEPTSEDDQPAVRRSRWRAAGYYVKYVFLRVFWPRGLDWGD